MKRKHRHELKQNDFLVWLEETGDWIARTRSRWIAGIVVIVVAGAVLGGLYWYSQSRAREAQSHLAAALETFHAEIRTGEEAPAGETSAPVYDSLGEKYEDALAALQKVREDYPRTEQARQASYYAGLSLAWLGRHEEAEKLLSEVARGERDLLYYLASQELAYVRAARGDYDGAVEQYRLLVEDANNPLPRDRHLFQLAQVEEKAGRIEQAHQSYQRFLEEFPTSPLRSEALQRSELLELRLREKA